MKLKNIVILTGAGISAESSIKTFRDQNGLWENHAIEDVASPEGFRKNPSLVYQFYNIRRQQLSSPKVQPNLAHLSLAKLERKHSGKITIITQNVDDLHERSGSQNIWHMHGELRKMRCQISQQVYEAPESFDGTTVCQCCKKKGHLRPHIVWFGEMPLYMQEINQFLQQADCFISVGTSGQVYPAAMFVQWVNRKARKIEVNLDQTQISPQFNQHLMGPASQKVPQLVDELLFTVC